MLKQDDTNNNNVSQNHLALAHGMNHLNTSNNVRRGIMNPPTRWSGVCRGEKGEKAKMKPATEEWVSIINLNI
jgi:hypothetical protein